MRLLVLGYLVLVQIAVSADSTVPVPDPIKEPSGAITIRGTAGASQELHKVFIEPLTRDKNGNLGRASAHESVEHNLNVSVALPVGSYEILYSHTVMFVELAAGENKIIDLRKISVPKIDGTYSVTLFADLTNVDELNKRLEALWGQGSIPTFPIPPQMPHDQVSVICRAKKWKGAGASGCTAWMGSTYASLVHGGVKADKDANLWMVDFQYSVGTVDKNNVVTSVEPDSSGTVFKNFGRRDLGYGADGDFFSVLPGVYGLEFRSLTGKVSTQMGIVIN